MKSNGGSAIQIIEYEMGETNDSRHRDGKRNERFENYKNMNENDPTSTTTTAAK